MPSPKHPPPNAHFSPSPTPGPSFGWGNSRASAPQGKVLSPACLLPSAPESHFNLYRIIISNYWEAGKKISKNKNILRKLFFLPSFSSFCDPGPFPKLVPHATAPKLSVSKRKKHPGQGWPWQKHQCHTDRTPAPAVLLSITEPSL